MATNTVTVESETLEAFLPDLVTAICDDVQRITDQCLSSGLISDSGRRRILELKGRENQARALIQSVQNSTKTDNRCFEIFLDGLDKELPRLVKEKLLSNIKKDLADRQTTVVPYDQAAAMAEGSMELENVSETMRRSNLEDIKSRFAILLSEVKSILEVNHVTASDVRTVLVGMFAQSDEYIPNTNLEEIFVAATRHNLWNYWHHSPVEKVLCRCLPNHKISLIREYKELLSGFCATTKLIDYIRDANIDLQKGRNELPLGSYTREQCRKLMVILDIKRNITKLSLQYVQDLWERFAEEFDIPFLTAVLDSILTGSLVITWLIPPDMAQKIIASAHKFTISFQEYHIIYVVINDEPLYDHTQQSKSIIPLQTKSLKFKEMSTRQVQPLDLATLLRDPIRRARAQSRKNIEDDDENARLAIHHLEKSIKEFEQVNKAIAEDHRSFVNDLAKEKDWLSSTKEWDREDEEWRQGEMATRLYNLKEATKAGNFHSLRFVQDFFQQKHMSLDRMGNIEIECHLYREVLQIEMERSKIVRGHHRKRKEHDKRVNDLLKEIEDLENLIRKRVRVYEEITEGLKQLGVEQTKLNELDEEMEKVKTTSHECTKTRKDCTKVYETGNRNLQQSRYQVQELLRSSRNFISHVEHMEEQLKSQQEAQESLLAKMMTGALYGASVGNQFIPVIGIIPGGIIGGVGSLIKGLFKDNERLTRQLQDSIENNRRMIQNCGEILTRANTERDELSLTLLDDC